MDVQTAPRPTGRRTLTPAKLAALDHPPPRPGGPAKNEVSAAFCRAAPALGTVRLRPLIDALLKRSFPQDRTGDHRPMVWVSNETLCAELDVGEGRLKQLIGAAFEGGLIAMRDSGNGHRRGAREKGDGGRILWAFGFDLSPLAARVAEFRELADAWERREAAVRRSRVEVSGLRRAVLTLADLGRTTAPDAADWSDVADRARRIAGRGKNQRDADVLRMLADELAAMRDGAKAVLDAAPSGGEPAKSDPEGSPTEPLNATTTQPRNPKKHTKADERVQPRPRPPASSPAAEPADVLRDFPATPAFVLAIAAPFRAFVPGGRPTREQVVEAAWHVRGHFGISQPLWAQVCLTFGRWEAAVALAAVAGRHAVGEVRSPGGLLCKMLELHGRGELRLDRTLRGLAARLAGPRAPLAPPPGLPPRASDAGDDGASPAPHDARKSFDERVREAIAQRSVPKGWIAEGRSRGARARGHAARTPSAGVLSSKGNDRPPARV